MVILAWIVLGVLTLIFLAVVCSMDGGCLGLIISIIFTALLTWALLTISG